MKKARFRTKIILLYIALGLLPILIFFGVVSKIYTDSLQEKTNNLLNYAMNQTAKNLENNISSLNSIIASTLGDTDIRNLLFQYDSPSSNKTSIKYLLRTRFSSFCTHEPQLKSIVFIGNDLGYTMYRRYDVPFTTIWNSPELRKQMLSITKNSDITPGDLGILVFSSRQFSDIPNSEEESLYFISPSYDMVTKKLYGTIIFEIDLDYWQEIIRPDTGGYALDVTEGSQIYLVNQSGDIIFSLSPDTVGQKIDNFLYFRDGNTDIWSFPIDGSSLLLYSFYDHGIAAKDVTQFTQMLLFLMLITSVFFIIIVILLSRRFTNNINKVAVAIQKYYEGGETITVDMDSREEMYVVADQFHHMTVQINSLVRQLKEQNIHIQETTERRRKAEIQALQAQINPHFLYNTLDSINWKAIQNRQREISSMLSALASLLRYSISNIDTVVSLQAELLWLEKYVYLQSKRFADSFSLSKNIHGDAPLDFPIHKMLLQPIIENSILHGFDKNNPNKSYWIHLDAQITEDDFLKIEISDNGEGMDEKTLLTIQEKIENSAFQKGDDDIGISNIISRISLYYGEQGKITVSSKKKEGTVFTLLIPRIADFW